MSAKERKRKSAKECKRAQKCAKERKKALPRKNCKRPGLKQPGLGTPKNYMTEHLPPKIFHIHRVLQGEGGRNFTSFLRFSGPFSHAAK